MDGHLVEDLQHDVDEVVRALDQGDGGKVSDSLGRLQDHVDNGVEHGDISSADAQRLDQAIQALSSAVGDNNDQGD